MEKNNRQFHVIGMGEILWDILPAGKQLGGAPANCAYHALALGAHSYVVSAVGNDPLGQEILNCLKAIDLNREYIEIDDKHPTGTVEVSLDAEGKPDYIIHRNVAWDYIPFSNRLQELAAKATAVCYGILAQRSPVSHNTIRSFIEATPADCLRVFDINLRQSYYNLTAVEENLTLANCLKLNDAELAEVARMCALDGTEDEILEALLNEFDLKIIALTKGENGSRLVSLEKSSFLKAPAVRVVDTVGAGDAFTAALVMGTLQGLPFEITHRNASRLAAYVCTQKGATPKLSKELRSELLK